MALSPEVGWAYPAERRTHSRAATSGMAAQRKAGAWVARHATFLLRPLFWAIRNSTRNLRPALFRALVPRGSRADGGSRHPIAPGPLLRRSDAEATRRGVRGFAHEVALLTRPWDF